MTNPVVTDPVQEPVKTPSDPVVEITADDLLKQITAKDGRQKYDNVAAAVKSIGPAQDHIAKLEEGYAKLEEELGTVKAELEKRASVEDTVAQMFQKREGSSGDPAVEALDEDRLNTAISSSLERMRRDDREEANALEVVNTVTKHYGTAKLALERMASVATEIGMSVEDLHSMSKNAPKSVYKLLGLDPTEIQPGPVTKQTGTINPRSLTGEPVVEEKKSAMFIGATTKDMMASWNAHKPKT